MGFAYELDVELFVIDVNEHSLLFLLTSHSGASIVSRPYSGFSSLPPKVK